MPVELAAGQKRHHADGGKGCDIVLIEKLRKEVACCRADEKYRSLPIIIVSTESESKDKMKGFEAGANLYMVKPSSPEMMIEKIRMVLLAN